jgi:choline transport protein
MKKCLATSQVCNSFRCLDSSLLFLGWLTVAGWQATLASSAYLTGSLIQGILVLTQPNYVPQNWHATLLFWAIIAFCVIITTGASWLLPKFEGMILIIHILGFFGIMIPLLTLGPREDAKEVFTTFINKGGWDSQGLSFCIGMMGTVYAFVGGDGAIHVRVSLDDLNTR